MKHIIHIIVLAVITVVYISCEKEDYALQRLSAPAQLTASLRRYLSFPKMDESGRCFFLYIGQRIKSDCR